MVMEPGTAAQLRTTILTARKVCLSEKQFIKVLAFTVSETWLVCESCIGLTDQRAWRKAFRFTQQMAK